MLGKKALGAVNVPVNPQWGRGQGPVQATDINSSLLLLLCAQRRCHAGTGNYLPQTLAEMLETFWKH